MLQPLDYVWDLESYPNFFSGTIRHIQSRSRWMFEVSPRITTAESFYWFIRELERFNCRMIGFNNLNYDYPVLHHLMQIGPGFTAEDAYAKTQQIIGSTNQFEHTVWPSDQIVKQVDLYKIHHFDNVAKRTSLKALEFAMRSENVGDLPFPPGTVLSSDQMDEVLRYNAHDVDETERFAHFSADKIDFRAVLSDRTGIDMTNFNDTKIGKKYFEMKLNEAVPGITGTFSNPNQTHRSQIRLSEVIFPYVSFETPSLNNVLSFLRGSTITETKAPPELKDLKASIDGFTVAFGTGGIHGSVERIHVTPEPGWSLIDVDVTSYYPNLAIANRVYPLHLGEIFCDIYQELFEERKTHPKKTAPNEMLKLALNGVYGDSNNVYGPFYDPQYTMTITVNGQLLLCMLAERLVKYAGCRLIQVNTDGLTVLVHNSMMDRFRQIREWWESTTRLSLEDVEYEAMWIRDVNNYIAKTKEGKIKRIGAYAYERAADNGATREVQWHKDSSALVVPMAAEAAMVHGVPVRDFIGRHTNAFDFMLRGKATGQSYLALSDGTRLQKITRYIIANDGPELFKVMPPLKGKTDDRKISINKGWKVSICDHIKDFNPHVLNYDWYVQEAEKLVIR